MVWDTFIIDDTLCCCSGLVLINYFLFHHPDLIWQLSVTFMFSISLEKNDKKWET